MLATAEKLAINGGPKAFDVDISEFSLHPIMGREEIAAVVALMARGEISASPVVRQFEQEFADYHGMSYALAQNNGTSTFHAAYFAVGVGPDSAAPPLLHSRRSRRGYRVGQTCRTCRRRRATSQVVCSGGL